MNELWIQQSLEAALIGHAEWQKSDTKEPTRVYNPISSIVKRSTQ